jgi:hypothetical protein
VAVSRGWERWGGLAGVAYVVLFLVAFSLGIEVGPSDREIVDYYADSSHRAREMIAFFLIAGAAVSLVVFTNALRVRIARREERGAPWAALCWGGGITSAALVLVGNSLSRATAFAATGDDFQLDPDTRRLFEDAGLLALASGAIAAMLLVVAVSVAALRFGVLPRWLGWFGLVVAVLLPTAVSFVGFLVLWVWILAVSFSVIFGRTAGNADVSGAPSPP